MLLEKGIKIFGVSKVATDNVYAKEAVPVRKVKQQLYGSSLIL